MNLLNDTPGATDLDEEREYVCDRCRLVHLIEAGDRACDRVE